MTEGSKEERATNPRRPRQLGDPVRLRARENEKSWILKMTTEFRAAGIGAGDRVDIDLDLSGEVALLMVGKIPSDVDDEDRPNTRTVIGGDGSQWIKPPDSLLSPDPQAGGLGLDIDSYENANPMLFDPFTDDGLIGLMAIGFKTEIENG